MSKFMRLFQIFAFFICLLVGVHSNGNGIRVIISSDWDCSTIYLNLTGPELGDDTPDYAKAMIEQYKKQRFRVGIYKAGVPFPLGGYAQGEYKDTGEGGDEFTFAKIPDNWIVRSPASRWFFCSSRSCRSSQATTLASPPGCRRSTPCGSPSSDSGRTVRRYPCGDRA